MEILCVIDSLGPGGAQHQLVELGLGFKKKGNNVTFLTYHYNAFYYPILEKENIKIICIQEINYIKRAYKIRKYIRENNFEGVISFLEGANFLAEIAGFPCRKWKLIVGERSANPNISKSFKRKIYRWLHFLADVVVANSYANMKIVRQINPFLSSNKCKVIYNIVDFCIYKPSSNYHPRQSGKLKLLIAASHQYLKNLNALIEAINQLSKEEQSKIMVEWYGDKLTKPYYDNSVAEAKSKITKYQLDDVIKLFPVTSKLVPHIQGSDIVCLFSFYEGFPNIICEGMACAKPILSSAVSDIPIILHEENELLFDPFSIESITKALRKVLDLSDRQIISIGLRNEIISRNYFGKEKILDSYLSLFI